MKMSRPVPDNANAADALLALAATAMERLREPRPVFYNEADLQHALAWEIHLIHPEADIRLEVPLFASGRERLDLYVRTAAGRYAIELKFLKAPFRIELPGEPVPYFRDNQNAEDEDRYAIAQDLRRVERLVDAGAADAGLVLVLTNIHSLWRDPERAVAALDAAFRVHEGSTLVGELRWREERSNKKPVRLADSYACHWEDYSELQNATGSAVFRYLALAVAGSGELVVPPAQ